MTRSGWRGGLLVLAMTFSAGLAALAAVDDPPREPIALRWKFQSGQVVRYLAIQETTHDSGRDQGRGVGLRSSQTVSMKWTVKSVSPEGTAEVGVVIERIEARLEKDGGSVDFKYDSASDDPRSTDPFAAPLIGAVKAVVGAEFACKLSERGELIELKIPDRVEEVLRRSEAVGGGSALSADGLRNLFSRAIVELPSQPIEEGGSWRRQVKTPLPLLGAMILHKTYTDLGRVGSGSPSRKIGLVTEVELQASPEADLAMKVADQSSSGEYVFDPESGRVVSFQGKDSLTMIISAMGRRIEQKTTSTLNLKEAAEPPRGR